MERLQQLFIAFTELMKQYPWLGFAVSAWGLAVFTMIFRSFPAKVWGFIKRQCSTTLVFDSSYLTGDKDTFDELMRWFGENKYANLSRTIRIYFRWIPSADNPNVQRRGPVVGVSEDRQLIFWEGMPCLVSCAREGGEKMMQSEFTPYIVTIVRLGRNRESVVRLVTTMQERSAIDAPIKRKLVNSDWHFSGAVRHRPLHTVATNNNLVERIITEIERFTANEKWYLDRGIPYKLCFCLYGPPGTGKNTIVRAVASQLRRGVDYVNLRSTTDNALAQALLNSGNTKSLILFDDFDLDNFKPRSNVLKTKDQFEIIPVAGEDLLKKDEAESKSEEKGELVTLQGLLSILDGEDTPHGRIFFLTTNDLANLDKSVTRPGRIDFMEYVGLLEDAAIKRYIIGQYALSEKEAAHHLDVVKFNPLTGAELEQLYKQHRHDVRGLIRDLMSSGIDNADESPSDACSIRGRDSRQELENAAI